MITESKQYDNADFFKLVETELEECGSVRFKIKGWSMQPLIRNSHDEVLLDNAKGRDPQIGDICLFRFRGRHILHRYIKDEGEIMVMQGDNIIASCERCMKDDVVGIVRIVYRDGKELSPQSTMWHVITYFHRMYLHIRMFGGKVLRFLHLK